MIKSRITVILSTLILLASNLVEASGLQDKQNIGDNQMTENGIDIDVQALLKEYVDDSAAIGASVGLIDQGKIEFFSYGKKSVDRNELVSENTIFEIGSITKVFTTLILMDMVTKGEMKLDDPIEKYLPGVTVPEMEGQKITLRHLATHHSGLPCWPDNVIPKNPPLNPYDDFTIEILYDFLNHYTLKRTPGAQFEYSNVGMGLLGHILCLKTGKSYEQLISNNISKKLEMNNTSISLTAEMQKQFAKGHHLGKTVEHWHLNQALEGAGALRSNVRDMTKFLEANIGILNSPITDLLKGCHKQQCFAWPDTNIGLGWIISHSENADVIWHNGGTGGFRTFLGFNPKTKKGVVVLSNSTEVWPDQFGLNLLDPETYKKPVVDVVLAQDLDYLKRFEGVYEIVENDQKIEVALNLSESKLIYVVPGGKLQLIPEAYCIFGLKEAAAQKFKFTLDESGKVIKAQIIVLPANTVVAEMIPKALKG